MEHYLILSSLDSEDFYSSCNSAASFRTKLYNPLNLEGGWEIALISFDLKTGSKIPPFTPLLIQSSLCQSVTVIGGRYRRPVLKTLVHRGGRTSWTCDNPNYLPVSASFVESVDVYITSIDGVSPAFETGTAYCVLHLRKAEDK